MSDEIAVKRKKSGGRPPIGPDAVAVPRKIESWDIAARLRLAIRDYLAGGGTLKSLSDETGIGLTNLHRFISGERLVTLRSAMALMQALGVSVV